MPNVTLALCGDVMTGRGIDQLLPHPSVPTLYESWIRDARDYVRLAETITGPLPRLALDAVWGDALPALRGADARIINLETAVTTNDAPWPDKGIHYRMHPGNVGLLTAADIDCCVLANNHVLDWDRAGLVETLATLHRAGIRTAGAGRDAEEAEAPTAIPVAGGRVLVVALGHSSSGIPAAWEAGPGRPGVQRTDLSPGSARAVAARLERVRQPGDLVIASVHWGGNWGYPVPDAHRAFAHALIDEADVHLVHGHSSHHPLGIGLHRGRPILYGCGDLINDYEGITGHERYRPELSLLYLATLDAGTGALQRLSLVPLRIRHFRLHHAEPADAAWLARRLDRESAPLGARLDLGPDGHLHLGPAQPVSP